MTSIRRFTPKFDQHQPGLVTGYADALKPTWQAEGVSLYLGDCLEVLPAIAPKSIDSVITDPPFFMPATHYQSRQDWQRSWADTSILETFWRCVTDASVMTLKSTGHFIAFCNHESFPVFYPVMYGRFDFLKSLVWNKTRVGLGRVWRNQHELIIAARWSESEFHEDGKLRADVLSFTATDSSDRDHPVEKPVEMLEELVVPTCQPGTGTVLDPFMGSGTTLVAAVRNGRRAVGIEKEPKYFEIAVKRIEAELNRAPLFEPKPQVQRELLP